jgi:phosphate transport system substrate-binding protein
MRVPGSFVVVVLLAAFVNPAVVRAGEPLHIEGAGATFPVPLYSKWFDEFHRRKPGIEVTYEAIGSGAGIRRVLDGTVDFAASDAPMSDEQLAQAETKILHFPTVLGAAVPIYNVRTAAVALRFTPEILVGIFLGKITKWNSSEIIRANPGVSLPDSDIVVVHRAEGSGTTYIWTDYFSKVSEEWRKRVGKGTSVDWPVGLGEKGNAGVADRVRQTPNSIGYVELTYAIQTQLAYGAVQNAAGTFLKARLANLMAAAEAASSSMPDDFRVSITNPPGESAYPIVSYTWLLIPKQVTDPNKKKAMIEFLKWILGDGQTFAEPLAYAPLPKVILERELAMISQLD